MLLACCQQGLAVQVVQLYDKMLQDGVSPNVQTFMCLLQAYGRVEEKKDGVGVGEQGTKLESLEKVKALHANALKSGYDSELFVWTTLLSTYGKCASFMEAQDVFDGLPQRDVVSWNAMLAVCAQCGQAEKALQLYEQMSADCVTPNGRTFVTVLQACGMLAERGKTVVDKHIGNVKVLEQGKAIHSEVGKKGYESDVFIGNSLVNMYGKCGSILDTQFVFDRLSHRSVVVWTTMLAAHLQQGEAEKAMELYEQMREGGVSPNNRTLVNALEACGMVAEREKNFVDGQLTKAKVLRRGKVIHDDAQMKGYDADVFVGSALISMYGKCGSLMDAQDVFDRLLQRDVVSWNAMIAAYAQQGQADKALHMYTQMQQAGMKPNDRTFVSVLQACGMLAEKAEQIVDGPSSKGKFLE